MRGGRKLPLLTQEEIQYAWQMSEGRTGAELAELINERFGKTYTARQIQCWRHNHGLPVSRGRNKAACEITMTPEEDAFARENTRGISSGELAKRLNERFGRNYTAREVKSWRERNGIDPGNVGCKWGPGRIPWNKGIRTGQAPNAGTFRAGRIPHNKAPVGTEVWSPDHRIKVSETNNSHRDWVQYPRWAWEQANGPIPKGWRIRHINGDITDDRLENLVIVEDAVNATLNKLGRKTTYPEDILIAKIHSAKREAEKRVRDKRRGERMASGTGRRGGPLDDGPEGGVEADGVPHSRGAGEGREPGSEGGRGGREGREDDQQGGGGDRCGGRY